MTEFTFRKLTADDATAQQVLEAECKVGWNGTAEEQYIDLLSPEAKNVYYNAERGGIYGVWQKSRLIATTACGPAKLKTVMLTRFDCEEELPDTDCYFFRNTIVTPGLKSKGVGKFLYNQMLACTADAEGLPAYYTTDVTHIAVHKMASATGFEPCAEVVRRKDGALMHLMFRPAHVGQKMAGA